MFIVRSVYTEVIYFIAYTVTMTRVIVVILCAVKVVDMTGPETKILTGYGSLANQHAKPGEIPPTTSGKGI